MLVGQNEDIADLYGFGSFVKGVAKGAVGGVKAVVGTGVKGVTTGVKGTVKGVTTGVKGVTTAIKKAPGIASSVGHFVGSTALLPQKLAINTAIGLGKGVGGAAGNLVGSTVRGGLGIVGATGKGVVAPFKNLFGGSKPEDTAQQVNTLTAPPPDAYAPPPPPPPPPPAATGGGYGQTSPAAGYTPAQQAAQDIATQMEQGAGGEGGGFLSSLSTPAKLALAGGGAVGLYFLYKKFSGGGGVAHRSKS